MDALPNKLIPLLLVSLWLGPGTSAFETETASGPGLSTLALTLERELTGRLSGRSRVEQTTRCGRRWIESYRTARGLARDLAVADWLAVPGDARGESRFDRIYRRVSAPFLAAGHPGGLEGLACSRTVADRKGPVPLCAEASELKPGSNWYLPPERLRGYRDKLTLELERLAATLVQDCGNRGQGAGRLDIRDLAALYRLLAPRVDAQHRLGARYPERVERSTDRVLAAAIRHACTMAATDLKGSLAFDLIRQAGLWQIDRLAPAPPAGACTALIEALASELPDRAAPPPRKAAKRDALFNSSVATLQSLWVLRGLVHPDEIREELKARGLGDSLETPSDAPKARYTLVDQAALLVAAQFLSLAGQDQEGASIVARLLLWERSVKNSGLYLRNPDDRRGRLAPVPPWLALVYAYAQADSWLTGQRGELYPEQFEGILRPLARTDRFSMGRAEAGFWYNIQTAIRR